MALPDTRAPHHWTRDEYERMVESGSFVNRRVELIEGIVHEMAPQDNLHAAGLRQVRWALEKICPDGYQVDVQMPMNLGLDSVPEPDLAIVPRDPLNYVHGHPTHALLIVEVADSSLRHDQQRKARVYAQAGVQDFWIANLVQDVLEIYREPVKGGYRQKLVLHRGESIAPLARPEVSVAVNDLLPKRA